MKRLLTVLILTYIFIGSSYAQDNGDLQKAPLILTQQEVYKQIQSRLIDQVNTKVLSVVKVFNRFQSTKIGRIVIPKPIPIPIPQPIPKPKWVEKQGVLRKLTTLEADRKIRATLRNNAGEIIAKLKSSVIDLDSYDGLMVLVAGYQVYPLPTPIILDSDNNTTPAPRIPVIDVKRIKILSQWVSMEGMLRGLDVMIQGPSNDSIQKTYHALLYDGDNSLKARLISKTIPLPRYDGLKVKVYGYKLPVFSSNSDPDNDTAVSIIPLIDVRRIYVYPIWVVKKGFLRSSLPIPTPDPQPIPLPQPVPADELTMEQSGSIKPYIIYKGQLYDNDGALKANLYSSTIPLPKYNGFYVEIGGYQQYTNIYPVGSSSPSPIIPVIDVRRIKIIHIPPPIETWRGIIRPRIDDSTIAPDCPYILTDQNGTLLGYLSAKTNEIADLIRKYSLHFLVAVTGPVYPIPNSTSNQEIKKMVVEKIVMLQDLRHIIWMNNRPLFFRVGEEIDFNKIGEIIRPITLSEASNDSTTELFIYQKNWDFDKKLYPMPLLDNEGAAEGDNDVIQCVVPIDFTSYEYKYDSRIKCADNDTKCPDNPVYKYREPGIYKITITCTVIDTMGFVKKIETASRLIQIFPWFELNDSTVLLLDEVLDDCAEAQCETKDGVSNSLKVRHDTAKAAIRNMK